MSTVHLIDQEPTYEDPTVWCNVADSNLEYLNSPTSQNTRDLMTQEIEKTTCKDCLYTVVRFGSRARDQWYKLTVKEINAAHD